ncbi:MAG: hypothetical protein J6X99_04360 [Bacteroidales bacterium]|nr:hypothetical protein [Bacteroidales bacterium]
MKKLILFVLLSVAAISCQKALFSSVPRSFSDNSGRNPGNRPSDEPEQEDDDEQRVPDIYATAICFPVEADWREGDSAGGEVVLFKNGREVLRLPASNPPDPDRHRIIKGRLWTDSCDGHEVVVQCDGQEHLRYKGDEVFRGFLMVNDILFTLGQRQGSDGLCFRANGELLFEAPTGTVLGAPGDSEWEGGALSSDNSGVYFSYGIPYRKGDKLTWEYRVMKGADLIRTIPAGESNTVFDIKVHDGTVYRTEQNGNSLRLIKDDTHITVEMGRERNAHLCKLVPINGELLIKGYSIQSSRTSTSYTFWFRDQSKTHYAVNSRYPLADILSDGIHTANIAENEIGRINSVYLDDVPISVPANRYTLTSSRCAQLRDGILAVALTSAEGDNHLLIHNSDTLSLNFNGYFTSVQIY